MLYAVALIICYSDLPYLFNPVATAHLLDPTRYIAESYKNIAAWRRLAPMFLSFGVIAKYPFFITM